MILVLKNLLIFVEWVSMSIQNTLLQLEIAYLPYLWYDFEYVLCIQRGLLSGYIVSD